MRFSSVVAVVVAANHHVLWGSGLGWVGLSVDLAAKTTQGTHGLVCFPTNRYLCGLRFSSSHRQRVLFFGLVLYLPFVGTWLFNL
jgi:hypothetical protein